MTRDHHERRRDLIIATGLGAAIIIAIISAALFLEYTLGTPQ